MCDIYVYIYNSQTYICVTYIYISVSILYITIIYIIVRHFMSCDVLCFSKEVKHSEESLETLPKTSKKGLLGLPNVCKLSFPTRASPHRC